jgi:raffinose/stachyose/melibiose transport system permease protein
MGGCPGSTGCPGFIRSWLVDKIRKNIKTVLFFLLPGLFVYTIMLMFPIIGSLVLSFFKWNGIRNSPMVFSGIQNFIRVFADISFWRSLGNILWFMVLTLLTQLPIGLLIAVLLNTGFRFYKIFKAVFFVPQVLSTTVVALVWYFILMPVGVLNNVLQMFGLDSMVSSWLVQPSTAMTSIILVNTWIGVGFHMTVTYAAISGIPDEIIEAARLDGCTGLRSIFSIILPMIWGTITSCIIIIVTAVLKQFDLVFVMTEGGPNGLTDVPSTILFKEAFRYNNFGKAASIGFFIFILSVVLTVVSLRLTRREQLEY